MKNRFGTVRGNGLIYVFEHVVEAFKWPLIVFCGALLLYVPNFGFMTPANMVGVNVNFVISFTFFIGGACAAIAGTLIAGYYGIISPTMGANIGLKAFAAAVVGGIGVLHGAVVGGLVVGVAECIAAQYLGSNVRDPMAFVILILILIIRPTGFFGKKGITKV